MNENEIAKVGAIGSGPVSGYQPSSPALKAEMLKSDRPAVELPAPAPVPAVGETRVSFRVDGSNKDVIITVMDKESGQVIRTIPFDAMKDVSVGELFQYSQ